MRIADMRQSPMKIGEVPVTDWTFMTEDDLQWYKENTNDPDNFLDDYDGAFVHRMDNDKVLLFEDSVGWIGSELWEPVFDSDDPNDT